MEIIYFIHMEPFDGYVKIGRTKVSVKKRRSQLNTGNREDLVVYKQLYVPSRINMESKLHFLVKDRRYKREWFKLSLEEVDNIYEILTFGSNYDEDADIDDIIDFEDIIINVEDKDVEDKDVEDKDSKEKIIEPEIKTSQNIKKNQCDNCLKVFETYWQLERHMLAIRQCKKAVLDDNGNIIQTKEFKCENCGDFFMHKNSYMRHKRDYCNGEINTDINYKIKPQSSVINNYNTKSIDKSSNIKIDNSNNIDIRIKSLKE